MKGTKYDNDKPRWSLVPFKQMSEVVDVLTFGSKKYSDDNWKKVPDGHKRYFDAMFRHVTKYKYESKLDKETKKSHLAHAICCLLFMMGYDDGEAIVDDKPIVDKATGYKIEPDEEDNVYQPIPLPVVNKPMDSINKLIGETPHKCSLDTSPVMTPQEGVLHNIEHQIEYNEELEYCMEFLGEGDSHKAHYEYQGSLCDSFRFIVDRIYGTVELLNE